MSDPFTQDEVVYFDYSQVSFEEVVTESSVQKSDIGFFFPIALVLVIFVGSLMPWVLIRPLGETKYSYNLTDVPGGVGVLVTTGALTVIGAILFGFRRRFGLTMMSVAAGSLGWMASMSGLLLGVIGSLIPAISVAGIDLAKAQVGQGSGVLVSIAASLLLGILAIRQYEPVSHMSPNLSIRIIPLLALVPLVLIAVNHHEGWLTLGSETSGWRAEVPGDALYGSGLMLLFIYLVIGVWFLALIIRSEGIVISAGIASVVISAFSGLYAVFVWLGGKTLNWLIPSSLGDWSTIAVEPPLYVSLLSSAALMAVSIAGFFPRLTMAQISVKDNSTVSQKVVKTSDLMGIAIIAITILWIVIVRNF